jgi:hypothetical protein
MRRRVLWLVVVPFGAWILGRLADRIAERKGEGTLTHILRAPAQLRSRRSAR